MVKTLHLVSIRNENTDTHYIVVLCVMKFIFVYCCGKHNAAQYVLQG